MLRILFKSHTHSLTIATIDILLTPSLVWKLKQSFFLKLLPQAPNQKNTKPAVNNLTRYIEKTTGNALQLTLIV